MCISSIGFEIKYSKQHIYFSFICVLFESRHKNTLLGLGRCVT